MEKLEKIIKSTGMSHRTAYYSGRGATLTDLNSRILESISHGIEKEFGKNAAKNYVLMVSGIKVLSATTFLHELYRLCAKGWIYNENSKQASGIYVENEAQAFASIISMLGPKTDDTQQIKSSFLANHGIEPKIEYNDMNHMVRYRY